jgi:tRNA(Ile)-lysidine synthase TilS/MesJ
MDRENTEYVLLGHHKDDIIENIFANMCRGRNYLDLAVIRQQAVISNINIGRPMIQYYKNVIYDFADKYQVPYFKDTTPKWSVRGKYRDIISPAIEDAFTKNVKENLLNISRQADEWNSLLESEIINPFIESVNFYGEDNKIIEVNIEKYIDYPLAFWTIVLMKIFNHFGYKSPSKKSIQTFMTTIKYCNEKHKNNYNIILSNNAKCTILNNNIIVIFN